MSISLRSLDTLGVSEATHIRWLAELQAPHRHYHNLTHISSIIQCYDEIDGKHPSIIATAWLHDIVYDATRNDNEDRSAEQAREDLKGTSIDIEEVVDLIIDTKKHQGGTPMRDLFNDLDLHIFSAGPSKYDWYLRAIRAEYAHVSLEDYLVGRRKVLEHFDGTQIFKTDLFAKHEKAAHRNLQYEIGLLHSKPEIFVL